MDHTLLMQSGDWVAKGVYTDASGSRVYVEGASKYVHHGNVWLNESWMRLQMPSGQVELRNDYEIVPFAEGRDWTNWASKNPDIGLLRGRFMVADDAILSEYVSEDGAYSGCESFFRESDTLYRNAGFCFRAGEKLSSWTVKLSKLG